MFFWELLSKVLINYYVYEKDLEKENTKLREEIKRLQTMIDYQPGGSGYVEAKQNFDALLKEQ